MCLQDDSGRIYAYTYTCIYTYINYQVYMSRFFLNADTLISHMVL